MLPTFEVFGLSIPMFGVMMLCGMVAGFILLSYTRRFIRFTEDEILTCVLWTIILGFIGSKLLYWIVEFDQVVADPHFLIETLRSGFVFYGSLIGGLLGILIYAKRSRLPFFAFFDLLCPSFAIGQAFGRIGCFLAGCCYGRECAVGNPLAVVYPHGAGAPAGVPMLPTQLMESAFLFLLTIALVRILKKKHPFGTVAGWYCILYGIWRFIIEFFRSDDRGAVGALSTSQFIGIFIVLAGIALLILIKRGVLTQRELPHPAETLEVDEVYQDAAEAAKPGFEGAAASYTGETDTAAFEESDPAASGQEFETAADAPAASEAAESAPSDAKDA